MTRRLLASYLLLATFILLVVALPLGITYTRRAEDRLLNDVERDARVLGSLLEERVEGGDTAGVARISTEYAQETGGRVVVVDGAGISLVDSGDPSAPPRNFSTRPEFERALEGSQATGIRRSGTLNDELAYVAVPIASGNGVSGAVRVTFSTDQLRTQVRDYWLKLGLLTALVMGLATGLGVLMSRWTLGPVETLEEGAEQLAGGDLSGRAHVDRGPPELRHLATTFNLMATRLEGLVDSQRAFVADASHQLRTPLTALRLRLETLEDGLGDDPDAQAEVDALTAEVDRLGHLVEGLLALARSEGGTAPTRTVDAAAVADAAVVRWEALAAERGVTVVRHGDGRALCSAVDGALEQVVDNLVDNALDAVPAGTTIDVTVTQPGGPRPVELVVRDHGPGMTAEEQARATDRFWRGPASAPSGTGLGLAIVEHLVESGGGTFELRDPAGGTGLEAVVRLAPAEAT
ncbi:MAG: ATP-binding protein [Actinomycetes bacterium]